MNPIEAFVKGVKEVFKEKQTPSHTKKTTPAGEERDIKKEEGPTGTIFDRYNKRIDKQIEEEGK